VNIRLYIYTLLEHPLRTENPRDGSGESESESEREGRKSVEKERERERERERALFINFGRIKKQCLRGRFRVS
jgi:hypothetical protein